MNAPDPRVESDGLLLRGPGRFAPGYTPITRIGEARNDTGMEFGVLMLAAGESRELTSPLECAWLLLDGDITFHFAGQTRSASRSSQFDQEPTALHAAATTPVRIEAHRASELVVAKAVNERRFAPCLFDASNLLCREDRAKGVLDDTCYRIVRTVFDIRNRPEANLVLGEVVTFPGRWSSYPPHHHTHPEIYHYRFSAPGGYGHGESGEGVHRLRHNDTLKILAGGVHPQVAAPGYAMWYCWALRNLPGDPYHGPEFVPEHAWTLASDCDAKVWKPAATRGAR